MKDIAYLGLLPLGFFCTWSIYCLLMGFYQPPQDLYSWFIFTCWCGTSAGFLLGLIQIGSLRFSGLGMICLFASIGFFHPASRSIDNGLNYIWLLFAIPAFISVTYICIQQFFDVLKQLFR